MYEEILYKVIVRNNYWIFLSVSFILVSSLKMECFVEDDTLIDYSSTFSHYDAKTLSNNNSTKHQPSLNLTNVGLDKKKTLHTPHQPPTTKKTQCQQYLSCCLPDFDHDRLHELHRLQVPTGTELIVKKVISVGLIFQK